MTATDIQIRFADVDMAGHVHNAAYLHYFETARVAFFMNALGHGWDWKKNGFILKKNTVEYHQPIYLSEKIRVEVKTIRIGEKSFTLCYSVKNGEDVLKAYGESVIVCIDYTQNKTVAVFPEVRSILESHF